MQDETIEQRVSLTLDGERPVLQREGKQAGEFEILAITAGEGNGWKFGEAALQASLPLWDGAETFVDHGGWLSPGRSVRDLGGICTRPAWDAEQRGVKVTLKTVGPSGSLVEALAREWLDSPEPRPRLGFSADVVFTAQGREVKQILRVISLDLVFNPARGGAFVRALNTVKGNRLSEIRSNQFAAIRKEEGVMEGNDANKQVQIDGAQALRERLLETTLGGAKLPAALARRVREQFAGQAFEPDELSAAVEDARALLGELQAGSVIQGAPPRETGGGRISGMVSAEERLQAAVDDLLEAPRAEHMRGVQVEKLHGIRELYTGMTGDYDLHGGYYPQQARFATTATLPALVKNALNKIVKDQWEELGRAGYRWWEPVVRVEHFESLQQITGVLVGEVGLLPEVAEGAEYTELPIADNAETGSWAKYGGYLPLTLELIDRDQLGKLKAYPRKLANAATRKLSGLVADVFLANGGAGPEMLADHKAVFHADHNNLGSAALSSAAWEEAGSKIYDQTLLVATGQSAPKLALDPKYLLVPRQLRLTGMQILYPQWERQANIFSQNMQQGQMGDVITVPEFADAADWACLCDPRLAPAIYVGERFGMTPEIFISGDPLSPAMFSNDETRLKVRFFVSVFVADYRPMYKSNAA